MLGFLGMTADVTGFELDQIPILIGLAIAMIIQVISDSEVTETVTTDSEGKKVIVRGKDLLVRKNSK